MEVKEIEERLIRLEKKISQGEKATLKTGELPINPSELEEGRIYYAGKYATDDKLGSSVFADYSSCIRDSLNQDSFEIANILNAFASEERIDILKQLMKRQQTAKQLMENLQFNTTGKLYHHLSFLEKLGIIRKQNELYWITSRYIGCVVLIFTGVDSIIRANKK